MKNHPITLENRLKEYAMQDERVDSLFRSYQDIKKDMKMYLPAIFSYYPHYSTHDSSHSQNLISAIELILGEYRIQALSSADIWLILVTAQLHDIGMILPDKEIREIVKKSEFKKYLESIKQSTDSDFIKAATLLLDKKIQDDDAWFLNIKQSTIFLIADYMRTQHAERSDNIVSGDTVISRLLSLNKNGEMSHTYTMVGKICDMHVRDFNHIFTLYETDSILHISCHPRFVAALIRIGDLCDVDNGRFNDALIAVFGELPQSSLLHFYKHKTITRLCISSREICMSADIPFENIQKDLVDKSCVDNIKGEDFCHKIVREHQCWFNMIKEELKNLLLHAGEIFPEGIDQNLPIFKQEILINGKRSMFADRNLRLNFAPEKAYTLVEGYSLYDEQFTFVREIVQNSLDAMKLQLWRDLNDGRWDYYLSQEKKNSLSTLQPFDLCKKIYKAYHVEITTEINKNTNYKKITFQDNGIGISYDDLQNKIIRTGTSWSDSIKYKNELEHMPLWMRPTGGFGIGLHAAFAVTNRIEIMSKTQYEEQPKHIIINSGEKDGFVFVRTIEEAFSSGTKVTIEIEKNLSEIQSKKSEIKLNDIQSIESEDEFTFLIEDYLKKIICCPLFSVCLNGKPVGEILCTSTLYGAIFGKGRRDEKDDNVTLAITNDVPMRYIVWDKKEGNFYRILPTYNITNTKCSFKGIYLYSNNDKKILDFYYSEFLYLEALECLSAESKSAIRVDRGEFLKKYEQSIKGMIKNIGKPLLRFGEEQFNKQLEVPIGKTKISTENFLKLCNEIAKFSMEECDSSSNGKKEKFDNFIEIVAEESDYKKVLYFLYLVFAHFRYFKESISFLLKNLTSSEEEKDKLKSKFEEFLQTQFNYLKEFSKNSSITFDNKFSLEIGHIFGHKFGKEFNVQFDNDENNGMLSLFSSKFKDLFNGVFRALLGDEFTNRFNEEFGNEFTLSKRFEYDFESEFGSKIESKYGNKFMKEFMHNIGNHILMNEWIWLAWVGYCEKCSLKCISSQYAYFQSIPAFYFHYYIENTKTMFDIIGKSELYVLHKNLETAYNGLPFKKYLSIKEMKQENNKLLCKFVIEEDKQKITCDFEEDSLIAYYKEFQKEQSCLLCPTKYKKLGLDYDSINDCYYNFHNNLYILLPETIQKEDFIVQNQRTAKKIVDTIMQEKDTKNIIKYIYLKQQEKNVSYNDIRKEYCKFLNEFILHKEIKEDA